MQLLLCLKHILETRAVQGDLSTSRQGLHYGLSALGVGFSFLLYFEHA